MTTAERFFAKTKLSTEVQPGMETPCLEWTGARFRRGYGAFQLGDKLERAHRVAWGTGHGPIPNGLWVLHKCDNPCCVAIDHLFLGTPKINSEDMCAKGRQACGDAHGSHTHPERVARGDRNGSRLHPERLARGEANGARLYPDRLARGERHGSRLHPERVARGEQNGYAKLTTDNVRSILELHSQGWIGVRLAAEFNVSQSLISAILTGKRWKHMRQEVAA